MRCMFQTVSHNNFHMLSHFLLVTGSGTKVIITESTQNVPHCTVMNPGVTIKASEQQTQIRKPENFIQHEVSDPLLPCPCLLFPEDPQVF